MRTVFNIDWFKFQQRIRSVVSEVVEPVTAQHEHLKNVMAAQIMNRVDDLTKNLRKNSDQLATMRDLKERVNDFLLKQK